MKPSVRALLLTLLVAGSAVVTLAPAARAGAIAWRDWNSGLKESGASNRPVLVDVYTEWCGWCKRMDQDVYTRPDVREYLSQHFVVVRMNAESPAVARYEGQPYTMRTLASRFRVSGYPTTIFL